MITRTFKTLTARPVLVLAAFLLGMMLYAHSDSVAAQEADDPCKMTDDAVTCSYEENTPVTMPVADFSAMDPEDEDIEWAVEGLDAEDFEIDGGVLSFSTSPNYEMPSDRNRDLVPENLNTDPPVIGVTAEAAGNNVYLVSVRATEVLAEGQDPPALSSMLHVTVTVSDMDEDGSIDLSRVQPQVAVGLTATLTDPDQGQNPTNLRDHTIVAGGWEWSVPKVSRPELKKDAHWQSAGGPVSTDTDAMDSYEPVAGDEGDVLRVKVTYEDAEGAMKTAYKLSYHAVRAAPEGTNTAPAFDETTITLLIPESAAVGTTVGTPITATDSDRGDILTYVLGGDDAASFKINKMTGQLTVGANLNAERPSGDGGDSYEVTVTAHDPFNLASTPALVTVTATDVNEKPIVVLATGADLEMLKVDENHAVVGVVDDPDTAVNEEADAVVLGTYDATDEDIGDGDTTADASQVKLSLEGDDADQFKLSDPATPGASQELTFKKSPNFESPTDANQDNAYKVTIVATDKKGLKGMKALTIEVMNIDEPGKVTFSTIQPGVDQEITASVSDPDGGVTGHKWQWSRSNNEVGPYMDIDDATSSSYTPAARTEDDPATLGINEEDNGDEGMFLRVTVMYRDNQSVKDDDSTADVDESKALDRELVDETDNAVRAVPDVNRPPAFDSATMTRDVNELETGNVGDPVMASDPDEDSLDYTITGGADMGSFGIELGSGQITVKEGTKLDAEGKTTYEVEVQAKDPFGLSDSTMVTIMVLNVNEAPDFEADDPDKYAENGMDPVATFSAMDPEGADVEWSLEGVDGTAFLIDANGVLTFKKSPDFENPDDAARVDDPETDADESVTGENNEYEVTVRATEVRAADAEGPTMSSTQDITVTVTNVEEPGSIDLSRLQPQTSQPLMADLSDPDVFTQDTVTWQWSVPKVSRPDLENDNHWADAATGATTDSYTPAAGSGNEGKVLRVKAMYTDGEGAEKKAYKVSYHDVRAIPTGDNNAPAFDETTITFSIPESTDVGTAVGTPVAATDADQGDIITYVLGGTHASSFKLNKMSGQLTVGAKLDHEAGGVDGVYTVTVTAHDPSNSTDGEARVATVTITATDVNEKPAVGVSSSTARTMVDEKHPVKDREDDPDTPQNDPVEALVLGTYDSTDEDVGDGDGDATADARAVRLSLGGEDADDFVLSEPETEAGPRELTFKNSPNFESPTDANMDNAYKVTIIATDKKGLTGTKELTIEVENIDEDGKVTLSTIQPGVGQEITATLTDPDMGTTGAKWRWSRSDTEGGLFTDIDGATSDSYTPAGPTEDDPETLGINEEDRGDEGKFLRVTVMYRDNASPPDDPATMTVDESKTRNQTQMATSVHAVRAVPDVNRPPMFESASMMREVKENTKADGTVGDPVKADDPDDDALTYSISGGADMGSFKIVPTSGQIQVKAGTKLDYEEGQRTYMVEVTADDPFDGSAMTMVTITVTDVNEPPDLDLVTPVTPVTPEPENNAPAFDSASASFSVAENAAAGTYVGDPVTATDADDDSLTYSDDSMYFDVNDDGQIMVAEGAMLDYEMDDMHSVTVTASDGTDDDTIDVTIMVTDMHSGCATQGGDAANMYLNNDCEALLDAKDALGGSLNWSEDTPIRGWDGFQGHAMFPSLSGDPMRVNALHLQKRGLDGEIPDALGRLSGLAYLNAHSNDLQGMVPDALGSLSNLEELYLNNNDLTGSIPTQLGDLTNLQLLYLWGNDLTGSIPTQLGDLSNLRVLSLGRNQLTGAIPTELGNLSNLERLYVYGDKDESLSLDGGIPTELGKLTKLTTLVLQYTGLTGEIPTELGNMTDLVWLNLQDNGLTGQIPSSLGGLSNLEVLYLHFNELSGEIPSELGNLAALTNLWLKTNQLSGDIPSSLGDLTNLERVRINMNNFTGCVPAALANAPNSDAHLTGLPTCQ